MSDRIFDRETLLDLTVNAIPLAILLFFVLLFAVVTPFESNAVALVLQMGVVIVTGVALAVLTYYSGKAISKAQHREEELIPAGYSEEDAKVAGVPGETNRENQ
jgi:hypothetical protein